MIKVKTYTNSDGHNIEITGSKDLMALVSQEIGCWWPELVISKVEEGILISNFSNIHTHLEIQFDSIIEYFGIPLDLVYGPEYYNQSLTELYTFNQRIFVTSERLSHQTTTGKNSPIRYNEVVHYPNELYVFKLFSFFSEDTVLIPMSDDVMGYQASNQVKTSIPYGDIFNLSGFPILIVIQGKSEAKDFFGSFSKMNSTSKNHYTPFSLPQEGESKLFYL